MLEQMPGICATRRQGLWAVACCRRVWPLFSEACRELLEAIEVSLERTDHLVGRADATKWKEVLNLEFIWSRAAEQTPTGRALRAVWSLHIQLYKGAVGEVADAAAIEETGFVPGTIGQDYPLRYREIWRREQGTHAALLREVFGNPFRTLSLSPNWRTDTVLILARQTYDSRDFSAMPILADALQDAGCDNEDILSHCRSDGPHVRGCWVVDLVLGKA
jgi:hypothetical protein